MRKLHGCGDFCFAFVSELAFFYNFVMCTLLDNFLLFFNAESIPLPVFCFCYLCNTIVRLFNFVNKCTHACVYMY